MSKEEIKQSLMGISRFTNYQKQLISLLFDNPNGFTRIELSERMFDDGHTHRLAGVLAAFSAKLVPDIHRSNNHDDFKQYLDTDGFGDSEVLRLSKAFREALIEIPGLDWFN